MTSTRLSPPAPRSSKNSTSSKPSSPPVVRVQLAPADPETADLKRQIRELENKLALYRRRSALLRKASSLEPINGLSDEEKEQFTLITQAVAHEFRININEIFSARRPEYISFPRQVAMSLCYALCQTSLMAVGAFFGKYHGTVIHARKAVQARCDTDQDLAFRVQKLRSIVVPNAQ